MASGYKMGQQKNTYLDVSIECFAPSKRLK